MSGRRKDREQTVCAIWRVAGGPEGVSGDDLEEGLHDGGIERGDSWREKCSGGVVGRLILIREVPLIYPDPGRSSRSGPHGAECPHARHRVW